MLKALKAEEQISQEQVLSPLLLDILRITDIPADFAESWNLVDSVQSLDKTGTTKLIDPGAENEFRVRGFRFIGLELRVFRV